MNLIGHHAQFADSSMLQTVESMRSSNNTVLLQATTVATNNEAASLQPSLKDRSSNIEDGARWNNLAVELALLSMSDTNTGTTTSVHRQYELLMEGIVSMRKALEAVRTNCCLSNNARTTTREDGFVPLQTNKSSSFKLLLTRAFNHNSNRTGILTSHLCTRFFILAFGEDSSCSSSSSLSSNNESSVLVHATIVYNLATMYQVISYFDLLDHQRPQLQTLSRSKQQSLSLYQCCWRLLYIEYGKESILTTSTPVTAEVVMIMSCLNNMACLYHEEFAEYDTAMHMYTQLNNMLYSIKTRMRSDVIRNRRRGNSIEEAIQAEISKLMLNAVTYCCHNENTSMIITMPSPAA